MCSTCSLEVCVTVLDSLGAEVADTAVLTSGKARLVTGLKSSVVCVEVVLMCCEVCVGRDLTSGDTCKLMSVTDR